MIRRDKVMLAADGFLKLFNGFIDELYFSTAFFAYEVVVVVQVVRFVADDALFEIDRRGNSGFAQELERAIDGHLSDRGIGLAYGEEKFLHGYVIFHAEKSIQDFLALRSDTQTFAFEIF